ncbi:MAG TPA: SRPBCC family protein [Mycobacteriales bacterium]|nr:SRPBCC family protein [Mycobacteriales bacterium]
MPGDLLLAQPEIVTTRAVSIDAPSAAIWPWLVQMGPDRGGVYTYDWIENLLGLHVHSTERILPQFQHLEVGDGQRLGSSGPVLRVAILDPEHALVLASDDGHWSWAFGLYPDDGPSTRLVSRNRIALGDAALPSRLAYTYLMEPGSLVMERKMLLGIKQRAERLDAMTPDRSPEADAPDPSPVETLNS